MYFQVIITNMPGGTPPLSHEQCRLKGCAICYCSSGKKAAKAVTVVQEALIKEFVFSEYNRLDPQYPSGLCLTCYFTLSDHKKKKESPSSNKTPRAFLLPDPETYEVELRRETRSSCDSSCQCKICKLGRLNGVQWKTFFEACKGRKELQSTGAKYQRLCKDCLAPIYRGSNHSDINCKSKRQTLANISQAVVNSNSSLDLVSSKYIKSRVEEFGSQIVGIRSHTGGHPVTINVGKKDESTISSITIEQAIINQVKTDLSERKMENVINNLR